MLETVRNEGATPVFGRHRDNPLEEDVIILDESSMLDLPLAEALFSAIKRGARLILVGDADQLPSVGPGNVLTDLIRSGWFAVTALTQIFRQAENSLIVTNAHRVNRGLLPVNPPKSDALADFYWIEQDDPEKTLDIITRTVSERIPARFGLNPVEDVQILTPMNRGTCGTIALNDVMQKLLNGGEKPQFTVGERLYKLNDKLMQTVNNYDKSVFNGDLGTLVRINTAEKKFTVQFDGTRDVEYNFDESDQLSRAYAITVHKSQGCEFPAVVMPFLSQHYMMLQRNLLYTAMTRAKKLLVIVGSCDALRMAVENMRLEPRFSLLHQRLTELRKQIRKS
jgi:exodeoxyribonuclease V alpha subunit